MRLRVHPAVGVLLATVLICAEATQIAHGAPQPEDAETGQARRAIIYVDDDNTSGPWDGTFEHPYQHIQDGIDNATPGDTVMVLAGTYLENVIVDRSVTLLGEDVETTIIDAGGIAEAVYVAAGGVTVSGFTMTAADGLGAVVLASNGNMVSGNHLTENNEVYWGAIYLTGSSYNDIHDNRITYTDREAAIWLNSASCWNTISRNAISNNGFCGVTIWHESSHNAITENTFSENRNGIWVYDAPYNLFADNTFVDNHFDGISLDSSPYTVITGNQFSAGGGVSIDYLDRDPEYWATHTIETNFVEGAPIYYYKDAEGVSVPDDAAQAILVGCRNCSIEGLMLDKARNPIQVAFSSGTLIAGNVVTSHWYSCGIVLVGSTGNTIQGNELASTYTEYVNAEASGIEGINIEEGGDNRILDNAITGFHAGVLLRNWHSTFDNVISGNTIASFQSGMHLIRYDGSGAGNIVSDNTILGCTRFGLGTYQWAPATIADNQFVDTGLRLSGYELEDWLGYTITGNTVNGNPLYHFESSPDVVVPDDAGQVVLVDCPGFVVHSQLIVGASVGICAAFSPGGIITDSEVADAGFAGIWLYESPDNVCSGNRIRDCTRGIYVDQNSDFNTICANLVQDSTRAGISLHRVAGVQTLGNAVCGAGGTHGFLWIYGMLADRAVDGVIAENNLQCAGDVGIALMDSSGNELSGNSAASSAWYGVFLRDGSTANTIFGNQFVANGTNARELGVAGNVWDTAEGGNYWSDFEQNPGYPTYYEIPGDGDGVDWAPLDSVFSCPFAPGDIDGSCGDVDFADFEALVNCWDLWPEDCGDYGCSDLDGDGNVDLHDFAAFSLLFGSPSSHPPNCLGGQ